VQVGGERRRHRSAVRHHDLVAGLEEPAGQRPADESGTARDEDPHPATLRQAGGIDAADRRILALAGPALGALVVEPVYNLTDTAIVGHLGRASLGGLAVASAVLNLLVYGCGFLAMATTPRVAFLRASGDDAGAFRAAATAYWLAAALGLALAALVAGAAHPLAVLAGAHGADLPKAVTYLRVAAAGMPFVLVMLAGNGHLRGLADTRTPFAIVLVSNAVNVVVEIGLVYGAGWGVAGSALGTVGAQALAAAAFVSVSRRRARARRVPLRPDRSEARRLVRSGAVLVVRTLALVAALNGSTVVAARLGVVRLGGHQIALQVWLLVAMSLDALAVPAQILIGETLGTHGAPGPDAAGAAHAGARAAATEAALRVSRRVLRWGVLVSAGLGAATAALSPLLPAAFTADPAVRHQAMIGLIFVGASLPLAAAAFELDGILLGAGDFAALRRAMIVALGGFLPLALATAFHHSLGLAGVWGALTCWLATRTVVLARRWRSRAWLGAGAGDPDVTDASPLRVGVSGPDR
jgi:putative MATE family efflux protein